MVRLASSISRLSCLPILVFLLTLPAPDLGWASQHAGEKLSKEWKRASAGDLEAVGTASEGALRGVLQDIEAFRWAFKQMFPSVRLGSPVPTRVYLFKDWAGFKRFVPRNEKGKRDETVAGYFVSAPERNLLVMGHAGSNVEFGRTIVFHELTHSIVRRNEANLPLWLQEGLAEYYSTLTVEQYGVVIGKPPLDRALTLSLGSMIPLTQLLSPQFVQKLYKDPRLTSMFYAESWVLVHYLTLGNGGKRQKQASAYLAGLQKGLAVDDAFTRAFGCTPEELERELRAYARSSTLPIVTVPIPDNALPPVGKAVPLLEVEADALEADLLVRMGANEEAEKKLHPLFARAPTLPVVRTTLARLRLDAGQPEEAATLLSDVVRDQPDDLGAMLLLSAAHLESGALPDAVIAAERATALNTEAPGAWAALSLAAAVAGQAEQAESALAHLLKLNPEPRHIAQRAHDAFRLGCPTVAARDTALFLQRAGITHEMAPYLAFVGALSHRRLGQSDEANRLLERLGPVVEAGAWTEKVLRYLQGWLGADDFLQHAKDNGQKTEAHFYVGYQDLLGGRSSSALTHFRWIKERGAKNYTEYRNALAELARLEKAGAGSSK